jgi:hypothetical protein
MDTDAERASAAAMYRSVPERHVNTRKKVCGRGRAVSDLKVQVSDLAAAVERE